MFKVNAAGEAEPGERAQREAAILGRVTILEDFHDWASPLLALNGHWVTGPCARALALPKGTPSLGKEA